ncbi:MAG: pyrroloquinoline-quinone synthase PqqC [Nitrospira sp.]|nr:pyrroloquinoline-quinone synthase PqqC [Nitrospira sp.]
MGRDGDEAVKDHQHRGPLSQEAFVEWLTRAGSARYHDRHPFHQLMHEGNLTKTQLQQWVLNRYYYQTRIPIKDALILSKSEDPNFRRTWLLRIQDHDGLQEDEGGLMSWLELARGVGLDVEEVRSFRSVLPGVRLACDGYVQFVRDSALLEAVASSLTELFAPTLMARRLEAWKYHYPWVRAEALEYFQRRIIRAGIDSKQAVEFVVQHALTYEMQKRCVDALIKKTDILWYLLDEISLTYVESPPGIKATYAQQHGRRQSQTPS